MIEKTNEFFAFSPFIDRPNIIIQNVSESYTKSFDAPQNYHGFKIYFGGSTMEIAVVLFKSFMEESIKYMKDRFNLIEILDLDSPDLIYVISVHYTCNESDPRKSTDYFEYDQFNIIVPKHTLIDKFLYFVLPFNPNVWLIISFYIVFGSVILTIVGRMFTENNDFIGNVLQCLRMTLAQTMSWKTFHPISSLIYMIMIVSGFVLVNLYSLYLGIFLITDVRSNDFKVAVSIGDDFFASDVKMRGMQFVKQDSFTYAMNLITLNTEYGYIVNTYLWKNQALKENFSIMGNDMGWLSLPILGMLKKNSIFEKLANDFVINAYSSGLFRKWIEQSLHIENTKTSEIERDDFLNLYDLQLSLYFYMFGMLLSCVSFLVEIF